VNELKNVDVHSALTAIEAGAILLDVRQIDEWEAGHAPTAIHVSLNDLPDRLDDLAKDRLIVCVCRSGGRSTRATMFLLEQGFDAVNLEGGMLAWSSLGADMVAETGEPTVV